MSDDEEIRALLAAKARLTETLRKREQFTSLERYAPYPKQLEFHAMGAVKRERLFSAANQSGKTFSGAAEAAYHLLGRYPPWWTGRRFTHPVVMLAGSESSDLTRQGMQRLLMGTPQIEEDWGSGMLPKASIVGWPKRKSGVKDAIDAVVVKHATGGNSVINFRSFDQGRTKWQADTVHVVWLDEEPPKDVFEEALTRTNATKGMVYITATPLKGMSAVVQRFFQHPGPDRGLVMMTLDDVGHYTEAERERIVASYDDVTRDARTRGIPVLGSGKVFPVPKPMIVCPPIRVPDHWPRVGGMDFGWNHPTAAVELAWDRDNDILYLTREYRVERQTPQVHAAALRQWGPIPWVWPHDGQAFERGGGLPLSVQYRTAGLTVMPSHVTFADGSVSVEAGLMEMLTRMNEGRWKVFETCNMWFNEFDLYHRDEQGKLKKEVDDLISASRYAMMGRRFARAKSKRATWGGKPRTMIAAGTGEFNL